jgi:hypothetical protein
MSTSGDVENIAVGDLTQSTRELLLIFQHWYTQYLVREDCCDANERAALVDEIKGYGNAFAMCAESTIAEAGNILSALQYDCGIVEDIHGELYRLSLKVADKRSPFFREIN